MWTDKAILTLSEESSYCREELFNIMKTEKEDLSDSSFRWALYNMLQEQKIFKVDYDSYTRAKPDILPVYEPNYSKGAIRIMNKRKKKYPKLEFVIFESVLLNEFLNHQIAQNTIYVQVEKDISGYVFDNLKEEHLGSVLYKPSKKDFDRYWVRDCIVVLDLTSQAPLSRNNSHEITGEKMLVDIVAEKSIAATFSPSELPTVYESYMRSYRIDKRKIHRYAGRRGKASEITEYIGD